MTKGMCMRAEERVQEFVVSFTSESSAAGSLIHSVSAESKHRRVDGELGRVYEAPSLAR